MATERTFKQRVCSFTGQQSELFPATDQQPEGWTTVVIRRDGMRGLYFLSPEALEQYAPGLLGRFNEELDEHRAKQAAKG